MPPRDRLVRPNLPPPAPTAPPDVATRSASGLVLPPGVHLAPASFPLHDVRMRSGVVLRYLGEENLSLPRHLLPDEVLPSAPLHVWVWQEEVSRLTKYPNPLRVLGSLADGPHGVLLRVSVSYARMDPSLPSLLELKQLFLGELDAGLVFSDGTLPAPTGRRTYHLYQFPAAWGMR